MNFVSTLDDVIGQLAQMVGATSAAVWFLTGMVAALAVGSVLRALTQCMRPTAKSENLLASLATWWVLIAALVLAFSLGRTGIVLLTGTLSVLALREFLRLYPGELAPSSVAAVAYGLIPLQYIWIWLGWQRAALVFIPLAMLVVLPAVRMASARPRGFVASTGSVLWAVLISVYGLSHVAMFHLLPEETNPVGGPWGWLLFLLVVTEANDMAQALTGRAIGRHMATPHLSPKKTWEGYVGGVLATIILAVVLSPWITPLAQSPPLVNDRLGIHLPYVPAVAAGIIIAVGGIIGDLAMSACKRDFGVKDFGALLPGHGGILDRFDSLTIAAPLFFHWVYLLDY